MTLTLRHATGDRVEQVRPCADAPSPTHIREAAFDLRASLAAIHQDAWGWALACCRDDRQAALDVLHDVYVKVLEGRARFAGRSSFKTWLFGVIRMTARSSRRRRLFAALLFAPIEAAGEPPSEAPSAEAGLDAVKARDAMHALPGRQREIAELVFLRDLTIAEAADAMGVSLGAARRHYARAKERLRAALAPPSAPAKEDRPR